MKRLTARNENGEAYYKRCYESPCDGTGEACDDCNFIDIKVCEALAAFEDNGITPEQMREISDEYRKVCEELHKVKAELAEYKRLEEQGLLLRLPCKVGDTLYRIDTDERLENSEIESFTVKYILICESGDVLFKYDAYDGVICHLENLATGKPYLDYYRVFLTKEEAEQALKQMGERT